MKFSFVLVLALLGCSISQASKTDTFSFKIRTHQVWCQSAMECPPNSKNPICKVWSLSPSLTTTGHSVSLRADTNDMFAVQPFAELPFSTGLSLLVENAPSCKIFDDVFKTRPDIDATGTMVTSTAYHQTVNYCAEYTYKEIAINLAGKFDLKGHNTEIRRVPDNLCTQ